MSKEKTVNGKVSDLPRITYGHIDGLLCMFEGDFEPQLQKEAWQQSHNSTAVLIKNMLILYQDLTHKYYRTNPNNPRQVFEKIRHMANSSASRKILRLVFKWGHEAPQAREYLEKEFGKEIIEKYYKKFLKNQKNDSETVFNELMCIDETVHQKSPSFQAFIGKAKHVYISTNKKYIEQLVNVLKSPHAYEDEIFQYPLILYYAMAACYEEKITPMQYHLISQWVELRKKHGADKVIVHQLLDKFGQFTTEAKKYLIHYLKKNILPSFKKSFIDKNNLETLRKYFLKLPLREQIFIRLHDCHTGYVNDLKMDFHGTHNLVLIGEDDMVSLSFLPAPAYQCLINTIFPAHPSSFIIRLGTVDREEVETSHRQNQCYVSTYFQRPAHLHHQSSNRFFHKTGARTTTAVGLHDLYHGLMLSSVNQKILEALYLCIDVIRSDFKVMWTTGLWNIADTPFIDISAIESVEPASGFIDLFSSIYPSLTEPQAEYLPEIASVLMHIYLHQDKWSSCIDSKHLFNMLAINNVLYWKILEKYSGFFKPSDNAKRKLLKFQLIYEMLQRGESEQSIVGQLVICEIFIDKYWNEFNKNLVFKLKTRQFYEGENDSSSGYSQNRNKIKTCVLLYWNDSELSLYTLRDIFQNMDNNLDEKRIIALLKDRFHSNKSMVLYLFDHHFESFVALVEKSCINLNEEINDSGFSLLDYALANAQTVKWRILNDLKDQCHKENSEKNPEHLKNNELTSLKDSNDLTFFRSPSDESSHSPLTTTDVSAIKCSGTNGTNDTHTTDNLKTNKN